MTPPRRVLFSLRRRLTPFRSQPSVQLLKRSMVRKTQSTNVTTCDVCRQLAAAVDFSVGSEFSSGLC